MDPPDGFTDNSSTPLVMKLKKGVYGLKQAGRIWNAKVNHTLLSGGFTQLITDSTIYVYVVDDSLAVHVDSNWAGNAGKDMSMRSRHGCIIRFAGGTVSWYSRLQSVPALSSTEAEYIALSAAVREVLSVRNILTELGVRLPPTPIYEDNAAVIFMIKNQTLTKNTRHIELRHHHIREHVNNNYIIVNKVDTNDNVADILTKDLSGNKMNRFRDMIGVVPLRVGVDPSETR
ncbi:DNA-directed DNA polymerase [Synchytrium endobioticum]|uniref:DNA-directed DNA polymerase n=1 Tax=Synchytrium endobioticum TaxID=286115 RepID=A0A507BVW3_9FUNG|nr:DNA-directed DNA polymerase [Synchytrium endobioticum]